MGVRNLTQREKVCIFISTSSERARVDERLLSLPAVLSSHRTANPKDSGWKDEYMMNLLPAKEPFVVKSKQ